jgi:hypothetical protein
MIKSLITSAIKRQAIIKGLEFIIDMLIQFKSNYAASSAAPSKHDNIVHNNHL